MHEKIGSKRDEPNALVVFQDKRIRRIWHNNAWFFSVVDVISALTDSTDAKDYWYRIKKREFESSKIAFGVIPTACCGNESVYSRIH